MRLIAASPKGVETLRWIEGERSAQRLAWGPSGEPATALAATRDAAWCATEAGVLHHSRDRGESWRAVFREPKGRSLTSIATVDEEGRELLVGTEPAAIHRSADGGASWRELDAFRRLGEREAWRGYGDRQPHVQTLAPDPHEPRRIYAGVELGGAYRSDDGGRSWSPVAHGLYEDVHELAVEPREGTRLYAATGGGFYVSGTRGREWRDATPDPERGGYCTAFLVGGAGARPGTSELLLATAARGPGSWSERVEGAESRLHRSRDGGGSWEAIELWGRLADRSGLTALARAPTGTGGVFVGTSRGALHHSPGPGEGWVAVYRAGAPIRRLVAF